jgi:hypothetical protein
MNRLHVIVLMAALAAAGCKKKENAQMGSGSGSPQGASTDAAAAAAAPDAAAAATTDPVPDEEGPFMMPAGAKVVAESEATKADATALGAKLRVHLVEQLAEDGGDDRRMAALALVVEGDSALVVELGKTMGLASDYGDLDGAMDLPKSPLSPPRAFAEGDARAALPFKGPLLYLAHWGDDEAADDIAVAQDGDAIVVWRSQSSDGEAEPWFEQGRIKLAAGATVTAR